MSLKEANNEICAVSRHVSSGARHLSTFRLIKLVHLPLDYTLENVRISGELYVCQGGPPPILNVGTFTPMNEAADRRADPQHQPARTADDLENDIPSETFPKYDHR